MRIKKWMIVTLAVVIFLFLTVRAIMLQFSKGRDERNWYVSQLNFEFSAEIDSVKALGKNHRLLFFHLTTGSVDRSAEERLNKKLKHNGEVSLFVHSKSNKPIIHIRSEEKYFPGDSLCVSTHQNRIAIYRKGKTIYENEVIASLNGRPF